MSYVRKIVPASEKLISIFRPHWIYPLEGLIWLALCTSIGLFIDYQLQSINIGDVFTFSVDIMGRTLTHDHTPILWLCIATGLAVCWPLVSAYISTEIGLTDRFIIHKRGIMFIEIDQVDLDDIRAEHVQNGWFGWLIGYGRIRLDNRFIDDVTLPAINNPYRLVKAIHTARFKHPEIEYDREEFDSNAKRIHEQRQNCRPRHKFKKTHAHTQRHEC